MSRRRKLLLIILALPVVGFILIQIIPVGRFIPVLERNPNPPVTQTIEFPPNFDGSFSLPDQLRHYVIT